LVCLASVLGAGVSIPANSDLNDYKTPGKYYISSDSAAASINNTPVNYGSVIEVLNGVNSLIQRFTPFGSDTFYQRRFQTSTNTWYNWYKYEGTVLQ
jgi:hypothetical protein